MNTDKGAAKAKAAGPQTDEARTKAEADKPVPADAEKTADPNALAAEVAELRDRLLRAHAEMENVRRRAERDKADTARYAVSNFARDVLSVGDNIHRAIEHVPGDAAAADPALKSFMDGIQLTERELLNVLERHGVRRLEPMGERFDPNVHQAMFELDKPDVPEGTVVQVLQRGYVIGDRCLRPALVAVAKGGAKAQKPEAPVAADDDAAKSAEEPKAEAKPQESRAGDRGGPKMGRRVDTSA